MRSDFFKRPTRMVFKFGDTEKIEDPSGVHTFEPPAMVMPHDTFDTRASKREVQQYGEHEVFNPNRSPVQKPSGAFASFNGPVPDTAEAIASPVPTSTKKRVDHKSTDK